METATQFDITEIICGLDTFSNLFTAYLLVKYFTTYTRAFIFSFFVDCSFFVMATSKSAHGHYSSFYRDLTQAICPFGNNYLIQMN